MGTFTREKSITRIFYLEGRGVIARALIDTRDTDLRVVVLAGSQAVAEAEVAPSILPGSRRIRSVLISQGMLVERGGHLVFPLDFQFASPSASAGVILGMRVNGRGCWRDHKGRSLNEILSEAAD